MPAIAIEQPSETDINTIHAVLRETYWSPGIPREVVARACANSMCAVARDDAGKLVGFARLVTDKATFAWLCDVIVLPGKQGKGLGRALVQTFQRHPELQGLRRWLDAPARLRAFNWTMAALLVVSLYPVLRLKM